MKKTILMIVLISVLFLCSCRDINHSAMQRTVRDQLDAYPDQRLVDLYKACFQGFLGPAHFITDVNRVSESIKTELARADVFEEYDFQPLPPDGQFVRVNLRLIKEGRISLEDFTTAFVKSARPVSQADIQRWKEQWPLILADIEKRNPGMAHFKEDKAFIESLLEKDAYVVHHSEAFIARYHPHYRLISAAQLRAIDPDTRE